MGEQKHTPEPWHVERRYDDVGYPMFAVLGLPRGDEDRDIANAMHAQSCVNALAGIDPAAVPDMVKALEQIIETASRPSVVAVARAALGKARGNQDPR